MFECFKHKKEPEIKPVITRPDSQINDRPPFSDDSDPINAYRHITGDPEIDSILLVVGHTKAKFGAATYKHEREYEWNKKLALEIKLQVERIWKERGETHKRIEIQLRDNGGLKGAFGRGNAMKPDLTLELHFNSFSKPAYGVETLVLEDDEDSAELGHCLSMMIAERFDFRKRNSFKHREHGKLVGVKPVGYYKKSRWSIPKRERGTYNLEIARDYTTAPFRLLVEPTFLNFKTKESEQIVEDGGHELSKVITTFLVNI